RPAVVEAAEQERERPAPVGEADAEPRQALEHAAEDERGDGDGRLERIVHDFPDVVTRQSVTVVPAFGDDVGVNVDDGVRPHALPASTARPVRPARRAGRPRRWRAGRGPSAWPVPSTW